MPGPRMTSADRYRCTKLVEELHHAGTLPSNAGFAEVGRVVAAHAEMDPSILTGSVAKGLLVAANVDPDKYSMGSTPLTVLYRKLDLIEARLSTLEERATTQETAQ